MKNRSFLQAACFPIVCLVLPCLSSAQSTIGIHGGLHLSDMSIPDYPLTTSPQANVFLGLNNRTTFKRRWALHTDLQYTLRGYNVGRGDNRIRTKMDYADLASKIEYRISSRIGLLLGAYAGYRVTEYSDAFGRWMIRQYPVSNDWDAGLQAGAAYQWKRWTAFACFSHGLKPAGEFNGYNIAEASAFVVRMYNKGLQTGLRYRLFNW